MKQSKPEHDLLLEEALALVQAAVAHDAHTRSSEGVSPSSVAPERSLPLVSGEITDEQAARIGGDPLVRSMLLLIRHVSQGVPKANRTASETERLNVLNEIGRIASDLDTLRKRVNSFNEAQKKSYRSREERAVSNSPATPES